MTTLYFESSETFTGGECLDPGSDWPDYAPEHVSVTWGDCYLSPPKYPFDQINSDNGGINVGDKVWIVVAYYSTGDTFSCKIGIPNIDSIYHYPLEEGGNDRAKGEAEARRAAIEEDYKENRNNANKEGFGYNLPWKGYFEGLDSVEVLEFTVKG